MVLLALKVSIDRVLDIYKMVDDRTNSSVALEYCLKDRSDRETQ